MFLQFKDRQDVTKTDEKLEIELSEHVKLTLSRKLNLQSYRRYKKWAKTTSFEPRRRKNVALNYCQSPQLTKNIFWSWTILNFWTKICFLLPGRCFSFLFILYSLYFFLMLNIQKILWRGVSFNPVPCEISCLHNLEILKEINWFISLLFRLSVHHILHRFYAPIYWIAYFSFRKS